jgi:hypothetical protein
MKLAVPAAGLASPIAAPRASTSKMASVLRHRSSGKAAAVMTREFANHNRPTYEHVHPSVLKLTAGLVAWFVLMAWVLFDRNSLVGLPLAFVTVLLLIVGMLLVALSQVWRRHRPAHTMHPNKTAFRNWSFGDFAIWDGKLRGSEAAIQILLPIAAGAFGLTAIGIVFLVCATSATT